MQFNYPVSARDNEVGTASGTSSTSVAKPRVEPKLCHMRFVPGVNLCTWALPQCQDLA